MARDKEEQKFRNEELMQQLNIQRLRFQEAERVVSEKKVVHQEIVKRGLDFLAEVELGHAPPLEFVVKNMQVQRSEQIAADTLRSSKLYAFRSLLTMIQAHPCPRSRR